MNAIEDCLGWSCYLYQDGTFLPAAGDSVFDSGAYDESYSLDDPSLAERKFHFLKGNLWA